MHNITDNIMNKIIRNRFANSKVIFDVMRPENHKATFSVKYLGFEDHYYALRGESVLIRY